VDGSAADLDCRAEVEIMFSAPFQLEDFLRTDGDVAPCESSVIASLSLIEPHCGIIGFSAPRIIPGVQIVPFCQLGTKNLKNLIFFNVFLAPRHSNQSSSDNRFLSLFTLLCSYGAFVQLENDGWTETCTAS
jgi:hypothetical protein